MQIVAPSLVHAAPVAAVPDAQVQAGGSQALDLVLSTLGAVQLAQIAAPSVVQAEPVAATPLVHVQIGILAQLLFLELI